MATRNGEAESKVELRSEARDILRTSVALMLATSGGAHPPSMESAARACRVSNSTIYARIGDADRFKRAMFEAAWMDLADVVKDAAFGGAAPQTGADDLGQIFDALLQLLTNTHLRPMVEFTILVERRPSLLETFGGDTPQRCRVLNHVVSVCDRAIRDGSAGRHTHPDRLAHTLWNHFYAVFSSHALYSDLTGSPEADAAAENLEFLIRRTFSEGDGGAGSPFVSSPRPSSSIES